MKIDKTTYKDRKKDYLDRLPTTIACPRKFYIFQPTFFIFRIHSTIGTLPFAQHTSLSFAKAKEPFSHLHEKSKFINTNLKINSYGNN